MTSLSTRLFMFVRSLVALTAMVVVLPVVLVRGARARFGGGSPLHGINGPDEWSRSAAWDLLTKQLTERTLADLVIRGALIVAWIAVVVFVVTVVFETAHMLRHDGLHLPDVRGLGVAQRAARLVAVGLVAIVPLAGPARVSASEAGLDVLLRRDAATTAFTFDARLEPVETPEPAQSAAPVTSEAEYVVAPGDSVYSIASRLAGPNTAAINAYAEQLLDLNLGREMGGGRRFENAALIDVGWVLRLPAQSSVLVSPDVPDIPDVPDVAASRQHVVAPGESLWSIAESELGDGNRWPELVEANDDRVFSDGRTLTDHSLIRPGWDLVVPVVDVVGETPAEPSPMDPAPVDGPTEPVVQPEPAPELVPLPEPAPPPEVTAEATPEETSAAVDWVAHDAIPLEAPSAAVFDEASVTETVVQQLPPPDQAWVRHSTAEAETHAGDASMMAAIDFAEPQSGAAMISGRRAAMLSAGVLTLLACRRQRRLRGALPGSRLRAGTESQQSTERAVRLAAGDDHLSRALAAIRSVSTSLAAQGGRVVCVSCAGDTALELLTDRDVALAPPWYLSDHASSRRWMVTDVDALLPADRVQQACQPCPTLVQLGVDERGWITYVDVEALEALEVGGEPHEALAIVTALAATLASSPLAELTNLVSVGIDPSAVLGHRLHRTASRPDEAVHLAQQLVGSTANRPQSTFELRVRDRTGEQWEPTAVLIGGGFGDGEVVLPANRTGLAVISASPIHGPSVTLTPDGSHWQLRPLGIRLRPVGLEPSEIEELAQLLDVPDTELPDDTIYPFHDPFDDDDEAVDDEAVMADESDGGDDWALMVRLMGGVGVVDRRFHILEFERSKTRELIAWLATHRDRATRSKARTALWEHDVQDATFANVVSDARRTLARAANPPDGEEWIGRTMSDSLPLHDGVVSDVDVVEAALAAARRQPPSRAIATLEPAVDLVNGLPFEGTNYLWPDAEGLTSHIVLVSITATCELASLYLSVGDIEGVFRATGRGLRVLPGHEELIGLRMRAHARAGDHAGVRHEWESYERMIVADPWSDGDPSPKLVELRQRLLHPSAKASMS